jgi:hypothetical protein
MRSSTSFDSWVRSLANPRRGQDCADGSWWEDVCWFDAMRLARRKVDEYLRAQGITGYTFTIYQDAQGRYQCVRREFPL